MTLEELLNKLIEKGWKVYWEYDKLMTFWQNWWRKVFWFWELWEVEYSLRQLVSKESWLWQFVCENGMVNWYWYKSTLHEWTDSKWRKYYDKDHRYRLCECALKDESELESFILDNIKIDE